MDPFETLGVKAEFALDVEDLERRHRDLSRTLHPDRYSGSGAAERRMALGRAIEVNEAFRTLKDPVRRAEALLRLRGVEAGEGREPSASPALLMQVMDRREALAEIRQSRDEVALTKLISEVRALSAGVEASLTEQLALNPLDAAVALRSVGELRYYRRFLDEAESIADDFL